MRMALRQEANAGKRRSSAIHPSPRIVPLDALNQGR